MRKMELVLTPYENGMTLLDFQGPKFTEHTPSVTSIVIDNSGSMSIAAEGLSDQTKERYGWSRLNVTQHAMQTMVATMKETDWVCVTVFSNDARVQQAWLTCADANKASIISNIMSIVPEGSTNFKAGLEKGFQQLLNVPDEVMTKIGSHSVNLVFLTDGLPSEHFPPARGESGFPPIVERLQSDLCERIGQKASLTAVAIGNDCNSKLLTSISKTFLHMPDPGSIAPFMVNLTARILAIGCVEGRALSHPVLCFDTVCKVPAVSKDVVDRIELGPVTFEQVRTIYVQGHPGNVRLLVGDRDVRIAVTQLEAKTPDERLATESTRAEAIELLRSFSRFSVNAAPMRALVERMQGPIGETFAQEVMQALEDGAKFQDWGRHYVLTIADALEQQRRTNFRDVALSHYASGVEEQIANRAEDAFASLTPPEPALRAVVAASPRMNHTPARAAAPVPTQMPDEFLRGGGCFGERSRVDVYRDGQFVEQKLMVDVRKGDELMTVSGTPVAVECVTFTSCPNGRAELVRLGDAYFTPWHPIRVQDGDWKFANQLADTDVCACANVFNVVMEVKSAPPKIGDRYAAPLGHGIRAPVVEHPFWGCAVLGVLQQSPGYRHGVVELPADAHPSALEHLLHPRTQSVGPDGFDAPPQARCPGLRESSRRRDDFAELEEYLWYKQIQQKYKLNLLPMPATEKSVLGFVNFLMNKDRSIDIIADQRILKQRVLALVWLINEDVRAAARKAKRRSGWLCHPQDAERPSGWLCHRVVEAAPDGRSAS